MKKFELVSGDEKCVQLVKINGTTALAKDAKPCGKLLGIVVGTDDLTRKITYYLCMETTEGLAFMQQVYSAKLIRSQTCYRMR